MLYHLLSTPPAKRRRHYGNRNSNCQPSSSRQVRSRVLVNILENADAFEINLAAPGLTKEDIEINVKENVLTISSDKESAVEGMIRKEFDYNQFSRSFTLSNKVNIEKITASMKDGVLLVTVPKKEEVKPISISIK